MLRALSYSSECLTERVDSDWISLSVTQSFEEWHVPIASRDACATLGTAVAALSKLGAFFPGDDPPRCFCVVQCAMVCIRLAMFGLSCEIDISRKSFKGNASPAASKADDSDPAETKALCAAMIDLEASADRVSSFCRSRIMQNKCFPLASSALECTKSYARLLKLRLSPRKGGEVKQSKLDSFVTRKPTSESQQEIGEL
ncbi:MAG: hypothetical protein SGARI_003668, partial [Bacillariaceae sp.]